MIPLNNTLRVLNEWAGKIRDAYRQANIQEGYNPSHELQNVTYNVEANGGVFELVFHMPDYFKYAEEGRGPGKMPPPGTLIEWMNFKGILPEPVKLSNGKTVLPTMESLEYVIRRKIGESGTKGSHTWQTVTDSLESQLKDAVKTALEADFDAYVKSLIKKK